MGITYGDHLIDSGYYDITPEQERAMDQEAEAEILSETEREIQRLRWENDMLTKGGIIEVAIRNRSVAEYMEHWESRALKAEAQLQEREMEALTLADIVAIECDEREILAREECARRGIDPDEICADGGIEAWMVVAKELEAISNRRA
jgi:hypothetical protein